MDSRPTQDDDIRAIENIIRNQLANVSWSGTDSSDWPAFTADFLPGAPLYPAARPLNAQSVDAFVSRMQALSQGVLTSFEQSCLGTRIHVFGNVAIGFGACQNIENGKEIVRGVEAYLFVKVDHQWRIAAQSWDTESEGNALPEDILD